MIQFTIPGPATPKGRPRFAQRGGFVSTYTPAATRDYEAAVRAVAVLAMAGTPASARPIEVMMEIRMPIPASWSKKKRLAASTGAIRHTGRPDLDNLAKAPLDACNGVCWVDDSQIVTLTVRKLYHAVPCVVVAVREVAGDPA